MKRAIINSSTFKKIFKDNEELLAMMASSLTQTDLEKFQNNITCNEDNPNNCDYLIDMPDDNTITIINRKTNEVIIINF